MRTAPSRLRMFAAVAALVVVLGAVHAQDATVIGTIDATLNGEAGTWYLLEFATDEGLQPTATWTSIMGTMLDLSLQAHPEQRYVVENALSLTLSLFSTPSGCPCSYGPDEVSVMHWPESSMFENVHSSDDGGTAEATITDFEEISEGVYRVEGTFSAEMPLVPEIGQAPDLSQVATIEGSFVVERLPESDVDLP